MMESKWQMMEPVLFWDAFGLHHSRSDQLSPKPLQWLNEHRVARAILERQDSEFTKSPQSTVANLRDYSQDGGNAPDF